MGKNDGGPAYPIYPRHEGSAVREIEGAVGMTLRDYFAIRALAGYLSDSQLRGPQEEFARLSYELADFMLTEREKDNG